MAIFFRKETTLQGCKFFQAIALIGLCGISLGGYAGEVNQHPLPPLPAPAGVSPIPISVAPPSTNVQAGTAATGGADGAAAVSKTFGTVYDPAFQNMTKKQFPLTPQQIKALRQIFQATQRASVAPIEVPTPTVSTQNVILSPGAAPPVIKMATGYVSSVVFVDETGQPWPIAGFSIGNPGAFNIQWDQKGNVLMIQTVGRYESTNMAIRLAGLNIPVMLTIVSDQLNVDYRVDLRIAGRGPNAKAPLIGGTIPDQPNPLLMSFLEGIPPEGSQVLTVTGGEAQAWHKDNHLYLRTRLSVLSPGWLATMSSADGVRVYEMSNTPMILVSHDGQMITLKVEGW